MRARRVAAAAFLLLALAPATASASLLVDHSSSAATETAGNGDGLIGPGDTFDISETLISAEPSAVTGVTSTLTSSTPGVTVNQGSSAYPNMAFGATAANTTPFSASLTAGAECGVNLNFSLALSTSQGPATIPFTVGTGTAGPTRTHDSVDVPQVIPDFANTSSTLQVTQNGRAKDVKVRIGRITHGYVGDLKLELIAPDGTTVVLVNHRGADGDDFVNTTFSSSAAQSITTASAPFSGTYRPEGSLQALVGHAQSGQWRLKVSDEAPNDTGSIESWGLDVRSAVCDGNPIASFVAAPNPALPAQSITFDASDSTDPNGTITKYEWDLDNNGTFELDTGTTPTTTHSFPARGAYTVGLRVTDNSNAKSTTTRVVSVTQPPVADFTATPASPQSGQDVTFDGSSSVDPDPGGSIVKYEWDLNGDGSFERDTGTVATTTTSYATPGTKTVRLRVTDEDAATAIKSASLVVQNQAPTASFSPPTPAIVGVAATFDGSASSDPDGTIAQYEWDLDGNGSYETDTGPMSNASHTYSSPGDVTVGLRVTDDSGGQATVQHTVRVTRAPSASFTATPNPVSLHVPVAFDGSASNDPDGPIAQYEWDLDGNGSYETDTGVTPTASRAYDSNGTYAVKLRVTDLDGATATYTVDVVASNGLPTAQISVSPNPSAPGQAVVLDASGSSDPDGTIVDYDWDLDGNGTYEATSGASPLKSHAYPNPGTYDVGVRVTDNDGGTATRATQLVVAEPPSGGGGAGGGGTGGSGGDSSAGGSAGGTGDGGGGSGGGSGAADGPFDASLAGSPIQRLRTVLRRGLSLTCAADRAATCTVRVELRAADARRLRLRVRGSRPVVVGSARVVLPGRASRGVRVRLSAAGRRALARARRVTLAVRGTATPAAGRGAVSLRRAFLLRR